MRFVPTKTVDQPAMLIIHRTRDLLVRQRTGAVNELRGQMGEFGVVTAKGVAKARELMAAVASDERIPLLAREALLRLVEQIRDTERRIEELDKQILALAKVNLVARRLMTVLTIGPYAATAIAAMVGGRCEAVRIGSTFRGLARPGTEAAFYRRQGSDWTDQQAGRQLRPTPRDPWRKGCGTARADRTGERGVDHRPTRKEAL